MSYHQYHANTGKLRSGIHECERRSFTDGHTENTKLSCRWQTARRICANAIAWLMVTPYWAFTRYDRRTDRSVRLVCPTSQMKRLHVPIVGPTGRSDPGYVRLSVRPVGQTGWTDCSRTAHSCQSNQCGLLANYNTAYAAAWLVVRLASRSDQSDVVSTRFDSRIGSQTK